MSVIEEPWVPDPASVVELSPADFETFFRREYKPMVALAAAVSGSTERPRTWPRRRWCGPAATGIGSAPTTNPGPGWTRHHQPRASSRRKIALEAKARRAWSERRQPASRRLGSRPRSDRRPGALSPRQRARSPCTTSRTVRQRRSPISLGCSVSTRESTCIEAVKRSPTSSEPSDERSRHLPPEVDDESARLQPSRKTPQSTPTPRRHWDACLAARRPTIRVVADRGLPTHGRRPGRRVVQPPGVRQHGSVAVADADDRLFDDHPAPSNQLRRTDEDEVRNSRRQRGDRHHAARRVQRRGPTTLAHGENIELEGDYNLAGETLNITAEEEDGEVNGEFRVGGNVHARVCGHRHRRRRHPRRQGDL